MFLKCSVTSLLLFIPIFCLTQDIVSAQNLADSIKVDSTQSPISGNNPINNLIIAEELKDLDIHNYKKDTIIHKKDKTQSYKINENLTHIYPRPRFFDMVTKLPKDFSSMGKSFVKKENLAWFSASLLSTLILLPFDQQLLDDSFDLGQRLGWPDDNNYNKVGPLKIIPKDIPSAIYYIGNGGTVILGSIGFLTYGLLKNDYRSYSVASQLVEGIFAAGIVSQFIKRTTGRESPEIAIRDGNPGGAWHPFPSIGDYQRETPKYDAMPSGHAMLYVASLTIIADNYPEHKWIKPVGYSVLGVLMFEMMATRAHWISDYPLAIFFGYIIGKSIAKNRFKKEYVQNKTTGAFKPKIDYTFSTQKGLAMGGININF